MYFAFGWPKTYASGIAETFVDVSHNADCSLIAFLSGSSVSVWSADQHRIHLGYVTRSDDSIVKFGKNEKICWCPDSSAIAIVMNDSGYNRFSEPCREGVLSFSWGPEGYHLVLLSNGNEAGEFLQLTFLKTTLSANPNLFAVAGKRGIILYNSLSKRWKMFGDRNQEQEIESFGLTWYKHVVVVTNLSVTTKKHEFLLYPKQHLDNSSLLYRANLPQSQVPSLIDCNDVHLALLTTDSFFYLYKIVDKTDRIELVIVHLLSMAVPSTPLSLSLLPPVQIAYNSADPRTPQQQRSNHVYCLILHASGRLLLSNAESGAQLELSGNIEQYWFTNIYRDRDLVGNTLWGYGQHGIQVWFPFASEEIHSTRALHHNRSLSFDNEVYPVGFLSELGVIVGLSQGISYTSCSSYPCYEIHIKTHPFLHSILKHLLERGGAEKAWSLSSKFHTIPHFTHSLELLLHETISENDKNTSKLEYVVNFLKKFPQFPEVSMRCARKIDATLWKTLFTYVGDPVKLYHYLESYDYSRKCAIELLEIVLDFDNMDLAGDLVRFLEPEEDELLDDDGDQPTTTGKPMSVAATNQLAKTLYEADKQQVEIILYSYASKVLKSKLLRNFLLFSRKIGLPTAQLLLAEKKSTILRTAEDLDMALNSIHVQFYITLPNETIPPFSPSAVMAAFSPTPSPTTTIPTTTPKSMSAMPTLAVDGDEIESISRDEMIESLKSRIQKTDHHMNGGSQGITSSTSTESINNLANSSSAVYSYKSHQFMVAPTSNVDFNDPSFLQDRCHEWVLVIGTVLLNPTLISKTLKKVPNIYESYCKMLSHQKPQGYSQLLKFIEDIVHPLLQGSHQSTDLRGGIVNSTSMDLASSDCE
eukprot:gene13061-15361_t